MPDGTSLPPEIPIDLITSSLPEPKRKSLRQEPEEHNRSVDIINPQKPQVSDPDQKQQEAELLAQIMKEGNSAIPPPDFVPEQQEEMAVETKKPQGLIQKIWQWLKNFFSSS